MIIKGNRHNNGAKLASYMMTGLRSKGERAELGELRGFGEAENIMDAFRDVEVMAGATKADNALFHVQVRLPDYERLTPEQWQEIADRVEKRLGLTGQPRAVYFHIDDKTGERHMHIGFSLIDAETMTVKPLPYFKFRLKSLARQLEVEFDLTRVPNQREGPIKFAATKAQQEQDRRLGVNGDEIRNTIRACWERADCGRSFDDALAEEALILVQGTRRDYLVMDHAGGLHALGKRILDVPASKIRDRLSDLDRASLPTIGDAREFMLDLPRDYEDRLKRQLAEVQKQIEAERAYAQRDPVRDEIQWEEALAKAAIAKEEQERQFVGSRGSEIDAEAAAFARATADGRAGGQQEKEQGTQQQQSPAPELGKTQGQIRLARSLSQGPQGFANALEDRGFILARVTPDDINKEMEQLQKEWEKHRRAPQTWMEFEGGFAALPADHQASARRSFDEWKEQRENEKKKASSLEDYVLYVQGKWSEGPKSQLERAAGGLAVITQFGSVYTLTPRNTGLQRDELPEYLKGINRAPLLSVTDAQNVMQDLRDQRGIEWEIEQHRRRQEWEKGRGQRREEWEKEQARTERPLTETLAGIRLAYSLSQSPDGLIRNLDEAGFKLARATKIEADRSHRNAVYAAEIGRYAPEYRDGEYVAINERGRVTSLNRRTTGDGRDEIEAFMRTADPAKIQGIEDTRQQIAQYKRVAPAREMFSDPIFTGGIPMPGHTQPRTVWQEFGRASFATTERDRAPDEMQGPPAEIWTAYKRSDNARAFVAALQDRNIEVAVVTREDVTTSSIDRFYATDLNTPRKAIPPKLREGDYVVITDDARIYNLNTRTTGESAERVQKFMATLDKKEFRSVTATLKTVEERAEQRDIERQAFRDLSAWEMKRPKDTRPTGRLGRANGSDVAGNIHKLKSSSVAIGKHAARGLGKTLEAIGSMVESLAAPKLTPKQIRQGEKARNRREAEADATIDFSKVTAEMAQERQQREQDREAARQRQRDGGGRER